MNTCQPSFIFRQGDTWKRRFVWKQGDESFNLRFTTAKFQIRTFENELVLKASSEDGNIIVQEDIGAVDLYFSWQDTMTIPAGVYVADLELQFLDNTIQSSPPIVIQVVEDVTELGEGKQPKDKKNVQKADILSIKEQIIAKKAGYK